MANIVNQFIDNVDLSSANSLTHLLDTVNNEQFSIIKQSPYYDSDEFIQSIATQQRGFTYMSLNCYSLSAKYEYIRALVDKFMDSNCPIQALALQESWFSNETDLALYNIPGYHIISVGHHASQRGGLVIYLHENWNYKIIDENSNSTIWEKLIIEINDPNDSARASIILGNIYRPPKANRAQFDVFMDEFSSTLHKYQHNSTHTYIGGDYNINMLAINESLFASEFLDHVLAAGYIPTITLPTRLGENSTLIDNIFTNNLGEISAGILNDHISDHQAVIILAKETLPHKVTKYITIRKNDEQSKLKFCTTFQNKDVLLHLNRDLHSDPNINYDMLEFALKDSVNECMPTKVVKFNKKKHKRNPWITFGIIQSINQRNKIYKKLKQTNVESNAYHMQKLTFNHYKNTLRKTIARAKKSYFNNLFDRYKHDLKKTWSIISETLNKSKRSLIPESMTINGADCCNIDIIVNQFNTFFSTITEQNNVNLDTHEESSFSDYLTENIQSNFQFSIITDDMTKNIISNMKDSHSRGHDGINTELLKLIRSDICSSITVIVNQCLTTGIFPNKLKIAKVIPIHKKNSRKLVSNYRPISVLPVVSKVFETVIFDQLTMYFTRNHLFNPHQYGYKHNSSTELAALEMVDRIIDQLNNQRTPINVYLDLSKAFDSIDHTILLSKLQQYGVTNSALSLLKSYLSDRYQYVQIGETVSEMQRLNNGVPQGSILGPLLFNIFIADITESSTRFNFIMYADDTTLNSTLESFEDIHSNIDLADRITVELHKILKWLDLNKLCLNVAKSKCMIFYMPPKVIPVLSIKIKDNKIDCVESFNFLGLTIDSQLSWKAHVNIISSKLSRVNGIMLKLKYMFPKCILKKLYSSLVYPHLNYCLLLWGVRCEKIIKLQKRLIRTIHLALPTAHTEPLLKKMNQLKLSDLYKCNLLKLYYKLYRNMLPAHFDHFLPEYGASRYPLRYDGLHMPQATRAFCEVNAKYQLHYLLRDISHPHTTTSSLYPTREGDPPIDTLILSLSRAAFGRHVKSAYINAYEMECNIINCINNCDKQ